jgi:hypothetical protein
VPIIGEMRKALLALVLVPAGAALGFVAVPARAQNPLLIAKVGLHNSFRISLTFPNGQRVRTIPAGTYTIVVHDYSRFHNFALGSITQNRRIFTGGISFVGTKRYTVKLAPGKWTSGMYAYACSAHPRRMHGTFVVTPSQTSSTTTSP